MNGHRPDCHCYRCLAAREPRAVREERKAASAAFWKRVRAETEEARRRRAA